MISKAYYNGVDAQIVLDNIMAFISANQTPTSGISSTPHLNIVEVGEIPEVLVEFDNDTMRSTYPLEPRNKPLSLWLVYMDCQLEGK